MVLVKTQEVSKSLLQAGNHADGIGRLEMQGKTCEIKAAEPKDPNAVRRPGSKGNRQRHPRHARFPYHPVMHPPVLPPTAYPFVAADPMGATQPQFYHPEMGGPPPPYPGYGVAGYMAPMYYPAPVPTPAGPPPPVMAPPNDGAVPMATASFMGQQAFPPAAPGTMAPPIAQPVPPVMEGQQQAYAFFPLVMAPHHPPPPQQTSVMQPVAPGIPIKPHSEVDGSMGENQT